MFQLTHRPRRLRKDENIRKLVRETRLDTGDLIHPLFTVPGKNIKKEIVSMPGCYHYSIDKMLKEAESLKKLGITAVILFGIPESKDEYGSGAYDENGIIQQACRAVKKEVPGLTIITDLCLCEYTSHGHCGVIRDREVDNDQTLKLLEKTALSQAEAGADIIAPSDMMDGRVGVVRSVLDGNGFSNIPIMAYSAKYSSAFYGPFRDAVQSAPQYGDRKSYQMDPANSDEALLEAALDLGEGADIIMVKPALSYLDIIHRLKSKYKRPVAAYNVSGEYSMIKAASQKGWINEKDAVLEMLTSIKRAGSDMILTYFARDAVEYLRQSDY